MRFISQYPAYGVQIRNHRVHPMGDGTSQTIQEPLYVRFTPVDEGGMIYEKEQYEASKRFNFHGSQQYQDEATPVDTVHRLGILELGLQLSCAGISLGPNGLNDHGNCDEKNADGHEPAHTESSPQIQSWQPRTHGAGREAACDVGREAGFFRR